MRYTGHVLTCRTVSLVTTSRMSKTVSPIGNVMQSILVRLIGEKLR